MRLWLTLPFFLVMTSCATLPKNVFERGTASWYGPGFQGKKTASGEYFDIHGLTAAHRTLPFGTILQVRSLTSRKSVQVRVNDRGPFGEGRVIDLSQSAAEKLGMIQKGEDQVEIVIIQRGSDGN